MNIINKKLLQQFRDREKCEKCLRRGPVQPHHITTKGMGGAHRYDLAINLVALCAECHDAYHRGQIDVHVLRCIAGDREGVTAAWIEAEIHRLRNDSLPAPREMTETKEPQPTGRPGGPKQATRVCSECGVEYPLTSEWFVPCGKKWFRGMCRECTNDTSWARRKESNARRNDTRTIQDSTAGTLD